MIIERLQQPITEPDQHFHEMAFNRQNQLTKPRGALGTLELIAIELAALQATATPSADKVHITIFAADHGVANAGVSAYPQAVTAEMIRNFSRGGAAINVLARQLQAQLEVINLGTAAPLEPLPGVTHAIVGPGTKNFLQEAAMSYGELEQALQIGYDAAERMAATGCQLYIGGEMGIGNTTSASAIAAALLRRRASQMCGPGSGLDYRAVDRKAALIQKALPLYPQAQADPMEALRCLGGFEIAALVASYIGAAQQRVPILVDGFIATVAALVATRYAPAVRSWMFFGHNSAEPAHKLLLESMDAKALLHLHLRLGEASGAALAVPLIRNSCALHNQMATFAEAAVSDHV